MGWWRHGHRGQFLQLRQPPLVDLHGFSQLEAESVVDTLELQGYLHFLGDPRAPSEAESRWDFRNG